MAPLVSILLPTYNRAEFLPAAIDSVLSQDFEDFELIIGDNASIDGTGEIIERYTRQDSRIRHFRNAFNVGSTPNYNLCYEAADPSSKYLCTFADDDWFEPTFLSKMVVISESLPSVAFVYSDCYRTDRAGNVINRESDLFRRLVPAQGIHRALREIYVDNFINGEAALLNRRLKDQIYPTKELFDPSLAYWPDYHLWLQLLTRGGSAYYLNEPLMYYRKHDGAMTMPANGVARGREVIAIFRDKLQGICPPDLEAIRREALQIRLAALGFDLLHAGRTTEAMAALQEALEMGSRRRLDISVAMAISSLPVSCGLRAGLWQMALRAGRVAGRV